jgi:hypothetical protein
MKNLVLTFLLALLVVATALSLRRTLAGTVPSGGQGSTLIAIGTGPVPPIPPQEAIGTGPVPPIPPQQSIGTGPVPPIPPQQSIGTGPVPPIPPQKPND